MKFREKQKSQKWKIAIFYPDAQNKKDEELYKVIQYFDGNREEVKLVLSYMSHENKINEGMYCAIPEIDNEDIVWFKEISRERNIKDAKSTIKKIVNDLFWTTAFVAKHSDNNIDDVVEVESRLYSMGVCLDKLSSIIA